MVIMTERLLKLRTFVSYGFFIFFDLLDVFYMYRHICKLMIGLYLRL